MNENAQKQKKIRYVFTCITCLANSQIRRTDPLSGTSIDEHWGPFSFTGHQRNRLMKLQLQKTNKKKWIIKKTFHSLKRKFSKWFFILAPLKGPDLLGDPLFASLEVGQASSTRPDASGRILILSLPRRWFLFFGTDLYAQCRKKRQKAAVSIFWGGDFKIVIFQGTGNGRTLLLVVDDAHFKKENMESLAMPHIHVFFLKRKSFAPRLLRMYGIMYIYFFCIHIFTR